LISGAVGPGDHESSKSSIWLASILGGKPRRLRGEAFRASLSPDEAFMAYKNERGIALADSNGENPRTFIEAGPREELGSPAWSADGARIVYRCAVWTDSGLVTTIESRGLGAQTSVVLVRDAAPVGEMRPDIRVWSRDFLVLDDRLIYARNEPPPRSRDQNLWELAIDPRNGNPRGEPRRLTDWTGFDIADLSITADGSQIAFVNDRSQEDVFVGDLTAGGRDLGNVRRLTLDDRDDGAPCWTADGSVVFQSNRNGSADLLAQGLDERAARDLVLGAGEQTAPLLTPDGHFILFWEREPAAEVKRLLRIPVAGGPAELVCEAPVLAWLDCATTPGGPCLLLEPRVEDSTVRVSRLDPVDGKGPEIMRAEFDLARDSTWALSPDGTRFALIGRGSESNSIRLIDARSGELLREMKVATVMELRALRWSPDGNGFFVIGESSRSVSLLRVALEGETTVLYEEPTSDLFSATPSLDGRHLAWGQDTWDSNIWRIQMSEDGSGLAGEQDPR